MNADEDALSGRPEVVGCGRSVGGVVTACVGFPKTPSNNNNNISNNKNSLTRTSTLTFGTKLMSNDATLKNNVTLTSIMTTTTPTTTTITSSTSKLHTDNIRPIQLQRMISRCSCEVFYIHYEPADPANLPLPHLIPPLVSSNFNDFFFKSWDGFFCLHVKIRLAISLLKTRRQ